MSSQAVRIAGRPSLVTDRAERGGCRLAHERGLVAGRQCDQAVERGVVDILVLATRPRRDLDDRRVGVGERAQQLDVWPPGRQFHRSSTDGRSDVGEPRRQHMVGERAASLQRAERCGPDLGFVVEQRVGGGASVPSMAGDHDGSEPIGGRRHWRSRSVSQMMANAKAKAITIADSTPVSTAMPPLAAAARTRRMGPGRR